MKSALLRNLNIDPKQVIRIPKKIEPKRAQKTKQELEELLQQTLATKFVPFESLTLARRNEIMTYEQHFANGTTNPLWLLAREYLMTGSKLAGIIGWSPFDRNEIQVLMKLLWIAFRGNPATRWGTEHESDAQNATEQYYKSLNGLPNPKNSKEIQISAVVTEVGLVRSIAFPFAGMSPDGILTRQFKHVDTGEIRTQRQLLEFKCPYKRRNIVDHWPGYDLYDRYRTPNIPGTEPNQLKQPLPQYYYPQLMWGGLILGSHTLGSLLQNPNVPASKMLEYVEHAPRFGGSLSPVDLATPTGTNLIDTDHPILFIVWANCAHITHEVSEPEVYHEDVGARTKWIRTSSGAIQLTEVDYNHDFATWMLETIYGFWRYKYMPRVIKKEAGVLLKGELDTPVDLESEEEEEE